MTSVKRTREVEWTDIVRVLKEGDTTDGYLGALLETSDLEESIFDKPRDRLLLEGRYALQLVKTFEDAWYTFQALFGKQDALFFNLANDPLLDLMVFAQQPTHQYPRAVEFDGLWRRVVRSKALEYLEKLTVTQPNACPLYVVYAAVVDVQRCYACTTLEELHALQPKMTWFHTNCFHPLLIARHYRSHTIVVAMHWYSSHPMDAFRLEVLKFLLKLGVVCDEYAMSEAARFGSRAIVALFLDHGAPVNNIVVAGAIYSNRADIVQEFLNRGVEFDENCIIDAAVRPDATILKLFVEKGVALAPRCVEYAALRSSEPATLAYMVEQQGHKLTEKVWRNSIENPSPRVLQYLLKHHKPTPRSRRTLVLASLRVYHTEQFMLLMEAGFKIRSRTLLNQAFRCAGTRWAEMAFRYGKIDPKAFLRRAIREANDTLVRWCIQTKGIRIPGECIQVKNALSSYDARSLKAALALHQPGPVPTFDYQTFIIGRRTSDNVL